jgi:RNA polymerase sigma factor (sigma-70 family)
MQADPACTPIEELLIHSEWIQRLARRLVADPDAANDIVQETWLAALRNPPRLQGPPRAWLARVLLNFARQRGRGESRRSWREAETRRHEASVPSAQALAERADARALLVGRVLKLSEPFRSTVLLRYFGGLTSLEIGHRQEVPPGTVRWRLKRALERLRYELDREFGGDAEVGALALVALAGLSSDELYELQDSADGGTKVTLSSETLVAIGMSAAALAATTLLVWGGVGMMGDPPSSGIVAAAGPTQETATLDGSARTSDREGLTATNGVQEQVPALADLHGAYDVTVVDKDGVPLAGAAVWVTEHSAAGRMHSERGQTDSAGLYVFLPTSNELGAPLDFPKSGGRVTLNALASGRVASDFTHAVPAQPAQVRTIELVIGGRDHTVLGIVQDASGAPIADAHVTVGERNLRLRANEQGDLLTSPVLEARTGADGVFRVEHLPAGRHLIDVQADGYLNSSTWRETSANLTPQPIFLRLAGSITGTLLDDGGLPLAGVAIDHRPDSFEAARFRHLRASGPEAQARTAADGTYQLNAVPAGTASLWARGPTGRAANADVQVRAGEATEWSPRLEEASGVQLRLIGPSDEALAGWYIQIEGQPAYWRRLLTDAQGRATLMDPPEKRMKLFVHAPQIAGQSQRLPLRAGILTAPYKAVNVIRFKHLERPGSLSGKLVDWNGAPFADAELFVRMIARGNIDSIPIDAATGAFEIQDMPSGKLELIAWCEGRGLTTLGSFSTAGAHLDVGALIPAAVGKLEIDWRWPNGGRDLEWHLIARTRIGMKATLWAVAEGFGPPPAFDLLPGDYGIRISRAGEIVQERLASVESGGTSVLTTGHGVGRQIHLRLREEQARTIESAHVSVRALEGGLGSDKILVLKHDKMGPLEHILNLPEGLWQFEASANNGLRGSTQLTVTDGTSLESLVIEME